MGGWDIWMCNEGDYYYYVAWYWDGLVVVYRNPDHVFDSIIGKVFDIKENLSTEYFLGGYFDHVKEHKTGNEILAWGSNIYVKLKMDNFKNTFCFEPSKQHATMPPDYKTELDTTDLCNDDEKAQYRQWISDMQWDIALGRIYIIYANFVLSWYLPDTRKGKYPISSIYMAT